MKNCNKQKFRRLALLLSLIALCPILLGAAPSHTNEFYVNDYADVLSDETESHILNTAVQLYNETTAQVCVLTIDSLDGEDISEYSVETFRKWGIGDKDKENGVLIVLSVNDREMWVTTGYGIEGTLTDTKLGVFRDTYAMPYYREDDFDTGTVELFNAIVSSVRTEEYGLEPLNGYEDVEYIYGAPVEIPMEVFYGVFALAFLAIGVPPIFLFALWIKKMQLRRYDQIHGTQKEAEFIRKTEKIKKILLILWMFSKQNRHGSGGFRGGGGFHGGGFGGGGGFRGGGGSTGGGGAGGRF